MKKLLIIIIVPVLLLPSVYIDFLKTEENYFNESTNITIKNKALIDEKSINMKQSLISQECEYMYGFNAYPGPEEIICFSLLEPSEYITVVCPGLSDVIMSGSTYGCDEIWYTTGGNGILYGLDLSTCEQWCIGGGGVDILDLAYDPVYYKMYGSSGDNYLYEINQYTGEQEQIGPFGGGAGYMIGMAFDSDGVLYGWDLIQDKLWTIDTETGEATEVGSLGISLNFVQGGDFCRFTDVLYLTVYVSTGQLYECDEDTGQCTLIGTIGSGIEVTGSIIVQDCPSYSKPPKTPIISGPDNGVINQEYNFTINTTDPNGDDIYYYIDWGDNTSSGWIGPYTSGEDVIMNHSWSEQEVYEIQAKAKDIYGLTSKWSESIFINIIKGPELEIDSIRGGLFKISAQIKNIGGLEAVNVGWNITLEGGALIGKETYGLENIPAGENITIFSNFIFGFGPTLLAITAEIPESSDTESRGGYVLLIYIHVNIGGKN